MGNKQKFYGPEWHSRTVIQAAMVKRPETWSLTFEYCTGGLLNSRMHCFIVVSHYISTNRAL